MPGYRGVGGAGGGDRGGGGAVAGRGIGFGDVGELVYGVCVDSVGDGD